PPAPPAAGPARGRRRAGWRRGEGGGPTPTGGPPPRGGPCPARAGYWSGDAPPPPAPTPARASNTAHHGGHAHSSSMEAPSRPAPTGVRNGTRPSWRRPHHEELRKVARAVTAIATAGNPRPRFHQAGAAPP